MTVVATLAAFLVLAVTGAVALVARRLGSRGPAQPPPAEVDYSGDPTRLPPWARPGMREP